MKQYTVKSIKGWGQGDMYSVTFEEANSEPVDLKLVGAAPQVGDVLTGRIEDYTTASGSARLKFVTQESITQEQQRQREISASWAIGLATQIAPDYEPQTIKATAEMILEIKKELLQ